MEDRRRFLNRMLIASLQVYDRPGAYGRHLKPREHALLQRWLSALPPGSAVLDAACGDGRLFPLLAPAAQRLVGLDAHRSALLRACQRRPQAQPVQGDLRSLPFREGSFSGIVVSQALEYVPPEERLPFLRSLAALLSPRGWLFISGERGPWWLLLRTYLAWRWLRRRPVRFGDYIYRSSRFGWQYHTLVSRRPLVALLLGAGFQVEAMEQDRGYVYALARAGSDAGDRSEHGTRDMEHG